MVLIKAPGRIPSSESRQRYLFLAGSTDVESWQDRVSEALKESDWVVLNPRREDWDDTWVESKDDPRFRQQVEWELVAQEMERTTILMYFDPLSKSPISLLELGLFARTGRMKVVCPEGFWKKGNVDLICERYGVRQYGTLEAAIKEL
jgi:Nucleoside 2-deoxyribosyltransferase like